MTQSVSDAIKPEELRERIEAVLSERRAMGLDFPEPQALAPNPEELRFEAKEAFPWRRATTSDGPFRLVAAGRKDFRLEELTAFDDGAFVVNCYHAVLGRPPEPKAYEIAMGRLGRGVSKTLILARLRATAEGRRYGTRIRGLAAAACAAAFGEIRRRGVAATLSSAFGKLSRRWGRN